MENHLIIFNQDESEHVVKAEMDKYLLFFSKEKVKENVQQRKIVIESLDMQIFFRKVNTPLQKFLQGKEFKTVKFLNSYPSEKVMNLIYYRAEEIRIEKNRYVN